MMLKMPDWKRAGPYKIHDFWLKSCTVRVVG